jgi:hypothetical protein
MRRPVDLAAMTRDVRNRCARVLSNLETVAQSTDPMFPARSCLSWFWPTTNSKRRSAQCGGHGGRRSDPRGGMGIANSRSAANYSAPLWGLFFERGFWLETGKPRSRTWVMHYFMDEGGNFIPPQGWAVICSLVLPHKSVGPARREINWISRNWPRKDGELKGGMLQPANFTALVEVLFRHDALLHASAIDVSKEDQTGVEAHKAKQCEGITKYLTPTHHPNFIRETWDLRRILERMSNQLYIQYVLTSDLIRSAINEINHLFCSAQAPRTFRI